jgi:hypothetical protein
MKPCDGNHPGREAREGPYTSEQCRVCWLYRNDRTFREHWNDTGAVGPLESPARALPCLYLGAVLDRLDCPCPGKWVRRCELHQHCTLEVCKACPDYEAAQ